MSRSPSTPIRPGDLPQILAQWLITAGFAGTMVAIARLITAPGQFSWLVVGLLGVLGIGLGTFWSSTWADRSIAAAQFRIRQQLLAKVFAAGSSSSDRAGSTIQLLTDGVERLTAWEPGFRAKMIGQVSSPVIALGIAAIFSDWLSALVVGVFLPLIPVAIIFFQRSFREVSAASRQARSALAARFLEAIQGIEILNVLGASSAMGKVLAALGEANRRRTMSLLARNQLVILVTDLTFSLFVTTVTALVAQWRIASRAITLADGIGLVLIGIVVATPISVVGSYFYIGMAGRAAGARIGRMLAGRVPNPAASSAAIPPALTNGIQVSDLALTRDDHLVLAGVSLELPAGSHTVITGPSGAGKSSLLAVLSGDLLPTSGEVRLHGCQLTPQTRDQIRGLVAVVRQRTWLFQDTLAANLRLGAPDASDDDLWAVLKAVDLADWARRLPDGLDTFLGERSATISGGQAQRISVARAICSKRPILLLDEPTAHVDLASEQVILRAVGELSDRTVVMVTHRRHGEDFGDQIIEIAAGQVIS